MSNGPIKATVTISVSIDPDDWATDYGIDKSAVFNDVKTYFNSQDLADHLRGLERPVFGPNVNIVDAKLTEITDYEYVTQWGHRTFDKPTPLVPRSDLRVGDLVASSHGYDGYVHSNSVLGTVGPGTSYLTLELGQRGSRRLTQSEVYPADSTIPVLAFVDGETD